MPERELLLAIVAVALSTLVVERRGIARWAEQTLGMTPARKEWEGSTEGRRRAALVVDSAAARLQTIAEAAPGRLAVNKIARSQGKSRMRRWTVGLIAVEELFVGTGEKNKTVEQTASEGIRRWLAETTDCTMRLVPAGIEEHIRM